MNSLSLWGLSSLSRPGWLWALAALAIPLVLHLLSRGQRYTVKVGSIRLLRQAASRRIRRLRPNRLALLAVRCLLLAAVALILAGPRSLAPDAEPDEVWLLVDPALFAVLPNAEASSTTHEAALAAFARLDQAADGGEPIRLLAPGLPVIEELAPAPPNNAPGPLGSDLWSFLREADQLAPATTRFEVLALDRLAALRGQRPALPRAVDWTSMDLPTPPTAAEATSPASDLGQSPSEPLHALVAYTGERAADAGFVIAALESAGVARQERTGAAMTLERQRLPSKAASPTSATPEATQPADLAFWLGRLPDTDTQRSALRPGARLITDSLLPYRRCQRLATLRPPTPRLASGWATLRLFRCEEAQNETSPDQAAEVEVLWSDALGGLLLETRGTTFRHLHLHSRFHPAWSDWVTRDAFPRWIADLVATVDPASAPARLPAAVNDDDERPAPGQAAPRQLTSSMPLTEGNSEPIDEERSPLPLWAGVAALLVLERWMALR